MLRFFGSFLVFGGLLGLIYVGLVFSGVIRPADAPAPPRQADVESLPPAVSPEIAAPTEEEGLSAAAVDESSLAVPDPLPGESSVTSEPREPTTLSEAREPTPPSAPRQAATGPAPIYPSNATEPITWVSFPRLGINVEVVPSKFVYAGQSGNWQVPAFKVGHAEFTGGAGQVGNAVLLGHVNSRGLGNVFQSLERARVGDILEITGRSGGFSYQVVDVLRVPRTEVSVLQPTDVPAISLITCTGAWLANLQDYAERVVVRGELVQGA